MKYAVLKFRATAVSSSMQPPGLTLDWHSHALGSLLSQSQPSCLQGNPHHGLYYVSVRQQECPRWEVPELCARPLYEALHFGLRCNKATTTDAAAATYAVIPLVKIISQEFFHMLMPASKPRGFELQTECLYFLYGMWGFRVLLFRHPV